jgi:hypothetical protein
MTCNLWGKVHTLAWSTGLALLRGNVRWVGRGRLYNANAGNTRDETNDYDDRGYDGAG